MGRLLITIGILFVVIGLFVEFGPHFLPLGHLPGDISITGALVNKNWTQN